MADEMAGRKNKQDKTALSPAHERFRDLSHAEHRELRDILLALYDAFDKRDLKRAAKLHGALCDHTGPHFRYEEETLHPLLEDVLGKVQVEHLNREHDRAIVDALYIGKLTEAKSLDDEAARQGMRLVRRIMPHVSDCDGLAIMVETMPEKSVKSILAARETALEENVSLLDWASQVRPRSFRDTYQRDYLATRRQARGYG
jgi:hemerythrin